MADDPLELWSDFSPEMWERLLKAAVVSGYVDAEEVGGDAGLEPAQIRAFRAWCERVEREDEASRLAGTMAPSTVRFLESLKAGASESDRAKIDDEIAAIRRKAGPAK